MVRFFRSLSFGEIIHADRGISLAIMNLKDHYLTGRNLLKYFVRHRCKSLSYSTCQLCLVSPEYFGGSQPLVRRILRVSAEEEAAEGADPGADKSAFAGFRSEE